MACGAGGNRSEHRWWQLFRVIDHRSGPERYWGEQRVYLVEFDEPQFDTDGPERGGPYRTASVWERYLEPLADRLQPVS